MAEHGGQRHQAHGHNRGADDAGACRHDSDGLRTVRPPEGVRKQEKRSSRRPQPTSRITPISTNSGTAISVWLVIVPKMRPERNRCRRGQYAGNAAAGKEQGHAAEGERPDNPQAGARRLRRTSTGAGTRASGDGSLFEFDRRALPSSLRRTRNLAMPWRTRRPPSTGMSVLRNTASMPPTSADPRGSTRLARCSPN